MSNSTTTKETDPDYVQVSFFYMFMCLLSLSFASSIFGIVSWIMLPKWRHFRHFVFITLLLSYSVTTFLLCELAWTLPPILKTFLLFVYKLSFSHWLMITTIMFYYDFVRVFTNLESTRYLYVKANVFGWVLPITCTVIAMFLNGYTAYGGMYLIFALCALLMCSNFIVYLFVLFTLFKKSRVQGPGQGIGSKVTLSTFAFVFTGSVYLWPIITNFLNIDLVSQVIVYNVGYFLMMLFLNLFFLMLKSHRELWMEYRIRMKNMVI